MIKTSYCPFCETINGLYISHQCTEEKGIEYFVKCKDCGIKGPNCENEIEAIFEWDEFVQYKLDLEDYSYIG